MQVINITIYQNDNKQYVGFRARGHAGMAESGQDIVCAGASILMINTINAMEEFTEDVFITKSNEKKADINFKLKQNPSLEADLLLKTMVLGLRAIQESYETYINLKIEEV